MEDRRDLALSLIGLIGLTGSGSSRFLDAGFRFCDLRRCNCLGFGHDRRGVFLG